jgi:hypothetical protein
MRESEWSKGNIVFVLPIGEGGCGWYVPVCTVETNGANVFCFLSSLPLRLQPPRQCLAPNCRLFLTSITLYRGCGLAYPHDWRGFVGAKNKTSVGLLVFNSSIGKFTLSTCTPCHISTKSLSPQHTHPSSFLHLINHWNILLILILTETFCIRIGLCLSICLELSVFVQIYLILSRDSAPLTDVERRDHKQRCRLEGKQ